MKINKALDGNHVFFMSDLHYGHENILRLAGRPFMSVEDMNEWLMKHLREELTEDDIVFDLGDMFWKTDPTKANEIVESIPAKIYKVLGNHDPMKYYQGGGILENSFIGISDLLEITVSSKGLTYQAVLCHFPMLSWAHKTAGSLMIHGHCHGNIDGVNSASTDLRVDVGVDGALARKLGTPLVSFEQIIEHLKEKTGGIPFRQWVQQVGQNL